MPQGQNTEKAAKAPVLGRLFYYNAGFLTQARIRRILSLAGYDLTLGPTHGKPDADDLIAVWGHSPYAARGESVAAETGTPIVRIEDAFLRSLHPGRAGDPPLGLTIDRRGMHFDASRPSDLEVLLSEHPLDDSALLARARACMARLTDASLSKYNDHDPDAPLPDPGYVLVIDQTHGDASVTHGRADANTFREMLYWAQENHPDKPIVIKTHPETQQGHRRGYYSDADATGRITLCDTPVDPIKLLHGAIATYTVSSQMGFEAICAGHRPHVFGTPFYAGWGLTHDHQIIPRRARSLTRAQLFAGAMLEYPVWYDPFRDQLCQLEQVIDTLESGVRAWRQDRNGWQASGMRAWKRAPLNQFFGREKPLRFTNKPDTARGPVMAWGTSPAPDGAWRVEDGFLRSRGLGADLVAPLSLALDDLGLYYDPSRPSRLETLITKRASLRPDQEHRAERLIAYLTQHKLSKYNLSGDLPDLPEGHKILVPGQVEDDASIRLGCSVINTNLALLAETRRQNPDAVILYKPHPDVDSGLRPGAIGDAALQYADMILPHTNPATLLAHVNAVWTMTSAMGFEALLRNIPTTTLGAPFYTGWGLTKHLGTPLPRRSARPTLAGLAHAALIDYPRYHDPVTNAPAPVEVIAERLANGTLPKPSRANRALAKLQGWAATHAHIWRK